MAEVAAQATKPLSRAAGLVFGARQATAHTRDSRRIFSEPGEPAERQAGARSARAQSGMFPVQSRSLHQRQYILPAMTERVPAAAPPVNTLSVRRYLQRCGGVQCPPGSCGHDEGKTIKHAVSRRFSRAAVRPSVFQPALALGPPGDRYEQEAERVAELVGASHDHDEPVALASHQISRVQLAGAGSERVAVASQTDEEIDEQDAVLAGSAAAMREPVSAAVQRQIAGMRAGGQPLPESVRAYFEPRFGHDFRAVRIHTGKTAGDMVRSLGARAFTVGTDLAFAPGQYAPETGAGRRLLAHELTHVVQQGGGAPVADVVQRAGDPAAIPRGLHCPPDLTATAPTGTDLLFPVGEFEITPAHTAALTRFVTAWVAGGGTDDVTIHGYASTSGADFDNWILSCQRAEAVQTELIRLGIPAVRVRVLAHGETSEFSARRDPNQRVVVLAPGLDHAAVLDRYPHPPRQPRRA